MPYYLVNVGYFIVLCAFLVRDMLTLRSLLLAAQVIVASLSWSAGIYTVAGWNVVFGTINIVWIVLLLRGRRAVRLPADLEGVYHRHFAAMTPAEFLQFWSLGRRLTLRDLPLVKAGTRPPALYLLLRGAVRVSRSGETLTELPGGYFLGEMSVLTGQLANADVDAVGEVEVMQWPAAALDDVRDRKTSLWVRVQSTIGLDMVAKLQRGEHQAVADA